MRIQYCSDLHLEFRENKEFLRSNPLQPKGDILLLAGDIVPFATMHKHADFFDYVSDHFETTYWIPGNHEYYHSNIADRSGQLNEKIRSNISLVNNLAVNLPYVKLIFSTLWSKISIANQTTIQHGMSDFQVIRNNGAFFSIDHFNELHCECRSFIEQELQKPKEGKIMVVTHHVPTFLNYPPKYKGDVLNEAFVTELFDFIEQSGADCWLFGHHHYNTPDFIVGNTRMITNQLGYVKYNEHGLFNREVALSL